MNGKISYRGLKKVLSPKELKNITGGSYDNCGSCPNSCHYCECDYNVGAWYQCGSGNDTVAYWACEGGTATCNPVD